MALRQESVGRVRPSASLLTDPTSVLGRKEGLGIHTGKNCRLSIFMDPTLECIEFCAMPNGAPSVSTPAVHSRLSGTSRSTALVMRGEGKRKAEVRTIEHLMSAAHVFDLGQLRVILESAEPRSCYEIPILDGSALQWCETLPKLNLRAFDREVWICVKKHRTEIDGKFVEISPGQSCYRSDWNCHVEFGSKLRESKYYSLNWVDLEESREQYIREIAPARTFAFRAEIEALKKMGLGLGGSLDNALVIDGDRVINPGGYRVESELATHKLLDAIGDFALLGRPIIAQFDLFKAGHQLHLQALKEAVEAKAIVPAILSSRGEILAQSEDL